MYLLCITKPFLLQDETLKFNVALFYSFISKHRKGNITNPLMTSIHLRRIIHEVNRQKGNQSQGTYIKPPC